MGNQFKVGDKVTYFYAFSNDDLEIIEANEDTYKLRRVTHDGFAHEFTIKSSDEHMLKLREEEHATLNVEEPKKSKCEHVFIEIIGCFNSLGKSCKFCDMKYEEYIKENSSKTGVADEYYEF